MRPPQRLGDVERTSEVVVATGIRGLLSPPHLQGDLQRLLQSLEPLGGRWVRDAEASVLLFVPRGADAEPGSAAGEDVESRHGLDEGAGMPVGHAGHHGAQLDPFRLTRGERQGGVALEHVQLRRADHRDLVEVVHHPEGVQSGCISVTGDPAEGGADRRRSVRPGEVGDLDTKAHGLSLRLSRAGRA